MNSTRRPTIGVVHHNLLEHRGGGDFVCAWLMEALKESYDLTYISWGRDIDWAVFNDYYRTRLDGSTVRFHRIPGFGLWGSNRFPFQLRLVFLQRYLKKIAPQFDLLISTYNELDFGRPGLFYIHTPNHSLEAAERNLVGFHDSLWRRAYHAISRRLAGFDRTRILQSATLVNSRWSQTLYERTYPGAATRVVYPPVWHAPSASAPWDKRGDGFLCVGNILPEKKPHEAIEIIRRLRQSGHDVHLHLVGDGHGAYADHVKKLAAAEPWVFDEGRLNREGLNALMAKHRYGLHLREAESFGIAVAEMAAGGMIPFVRRGGAQEEVVGYESDLLFTPVTEAVEKIKAVLAQDALQQQLLSRLRLHSQAYSEASFVEQIRAAVADALSKKS